MPRFNGFEHVMPKVINVVIYKGVIYDFKLLFNGIVQIPPFLFFLFNCDSVYAADLNKC
jgi:hypothetical protein